MILVYTTLLVIKSLLNKQISVSVDMGTDWVWIGSWKASYKWVKIR
jgi:hypothetical protein